ncbi:MAG: NAD(+)/NADH kinase [Nitrososphaerota archaeon]
MKALLISKRLLDKPVKQITKSLEEQSVSYLFRQNPEAGDFEKVDFVIVFGSDGDVLRAFHQMGSTSKPVLGVSESDVSSFLTEVGLSNFSNAIKRVVDGNYRLEEASRLAVKANGIDMPQALNEVAIFPVRSASTMEYRLQLNGEDVWRDYGDGVIVATPTGSTAYAMSAGGPLVHPQADVIIIVPVNSLDITRRPLIVSGSSTITISEISSRYDCEIVIDGIFRSKVKDKIEVSKATNPARLIRLPEISPTADRVGKKVRLAEELLRMPPSAKLVLKTLEYEGPLTQKDLTKKTLLPPRTIRLALSLLTEKGLVKSRPLLRDVRQRIYEAV